ncbi:hypothetical protein [Tahibacter harae]|uniref:Uncharacterized protein n=1 Tax=Tahibacter harae TaxID=2963937 RepID=A0ABT1QXP6_9GAMM|nr:hypothetical protein [Tahibacter harae]MCQ4167059.1 hypothetical protein [Tahibacter harae]
MHDWTLSLVTIDWISGSGSLQIRRDGQEREIRFQGTQRLVMPREFPWGHSISINTVDGPVQFQGKLQLKIEMQSGDVIEIIADRFSIPAAGA